jgi:hypothetical protein
MTHASMPSCAAAPGTQQEACTHAHLRAWLGCCRCIFKRGGIVSKSSSQVRRQRPDCRAAVGRQHQPAEHVPMCPASRGMSYGPCS